MGKKATQRKPWERWAKEGDTAFAAFEHYRLSGTSRAVKDTAKAVGKAYDTVRRYSSRFCWAERAQAWDDRLQAATDKAILSAQEKQAAHHMRLLGIGLDVAETTLTEALEGKGQIVECPACGERIEVPRRKVTVREAAALLRDGVTLQRLVTGEATGRMEAHIDVSKLEPGEAATLLELLKKAGYTG